MKSVLLVLLLGLSTCTLVTSKDYVISKTSTGFNVSVGDVLLLQHTTVSPMMFVGKTQLSFLEFRGNFRINNYVQDRIELGNFSISQPTADTDQVVFSFASYSVTMTLASTPTNPLTITLNNTGTIANGLWVRIPAEKSEQVYGLGEQYSYLNLRGRSYPIWVREQGVGRNKSDLVTFFADKLLSGGDYHTTYFPQPTFSSSRKYYFHYQGLLYSEFNFLPPNFHEVFFTDINPTILFNVDTSIKGLIQNLTNVLGRQPDLPSWVFTGAILGVQGGTDIMLERLGTAQKNEVPVNGLWIQDWSGVVKTSFGSRVFWDWKWNQQHYPGLKAKIADLRKQNIRVFAYINPNLNVKGDLYKEGVQHDYFVQNSSRKPYIMDFGEFDCVTVDLAKPAAFQWYKGVIQKNMIDLGLGGWMADFGEYLPADNVLINGSTHGRDIHNEWPVLWARLNREAIDEYNKTGDVVFWMRAGYSGTGKYTTLMWAGDQNVDFSYGDGLPSTIPAALNLGLSGVGITHFDIGGYTTQGQQGLFRTPELFLRSAEAAIFSCMFRTHEGNQPAANTQFYSNPEIEKKFGRLAKMFVFISNYTKSLVEENSSLGVPVQRPLFMEFPDDVTAASITYQFMFGPVVLVAPVIQSNVTFMKVYLPSGVQWGYLWNNLTYPGGKFVNVTAAIGQPIAFYDKNSSYVSLFSQIQTRFPLLTKPSKITSGATSTCNQVWIYVVSLLVMLRIR